MKHLRGAEFVDLIDGTLPAARLAHVKACDACRAQVDAMRSTLASARLEGGAEPSPLFWQHFASRVNAAIDRPPAARRWWPRLAAAGFGAAVVALIVIALVLPRPAGDPQPAPGPIVAADLPPGLFLLDDLDADEAWAVVRVAAADLEPEEAAAAGLAAAPGAAERVAAELTAEERAELVRLVESELKRAGA